MNTNKESAAAFVKAIGADAIVKPGGPATCQPLPLTTRAYIVVHALDQGLVGTPDYLGLAFFWSHEYKHALRDASPKDRKRVHDAWLKAGLDLDGVSPKHESIVRRVLKLAQEAQR